MLLARASGRHRRSVVVAAFIAMMLAASGAAFAQDKAAELFAQIELRDLIVPGVTERAASDAIRDLAADLFGMDRHWHKRIVRAGPNTLQPYDENPPERTIADDDVVFCDFGPIFEGWEADFGRTFVLGDDPVKHRLRDDLPIVWRAGRECGSGNISTQ